MDSKGGKIGLRGPARAACAIVLIGGLGFGILRQPWQIGGDPVGMETAIEPAGPRPASAQDPGPDGIPSDMGKGVATMSLRFQGRVRSTLDLEPVPWARVRLMCAESLLVEVSCDRDGRFEIAGCFAPAAVEDDRTHWVVDRSAFGVDEILPFDGEDPAPVLIVEAKTRPSSPRRDTSGLPP